MDPLSTLSHSRAVRLGAAILCGLGLAVSVFALIRAGQGLNEGRRAERDPQVVGSLAPTPALLPAERLAVPPQPRAPAPPLAGEAQAPRPAEIPAGSAVDAAAATPQEVSAPVVVAEPVPAAPTTDLVAGASPPPAAPVLAAEPSAPDSVPAPVGMPSGPMSPKSASIERDRPPPQILPAPTMPIARRPAAPPPARNEALRPAVVPGGSMAGVRAYTAVQDGGRVGPDGVRRIVVRVP